MPDPITVTPDQIANALDRAARYRRSLVPPEWQGKPNLRELIDTQRRWESVPWGDGWFDIGAVLDTFADMAVPGLKVYTHTETDRVKVQRLLKRRWTPDPPPWEAVDNSGIRQETRSQANAWCGSSNTMAAQKGE